MLIIKKISLKQIFSAKVLLLTFILCLGIFLRIYGINERPLLGTEKFTAGHSQLDIITLITPPPKMGGVFMIPLTYCLIHLSTTYWELTEFTLRLPSLIFGILGIFIVYKVGEIMFGKTEGLLAAFLLTLSPFHIHQSQVAKFYTIMIFFSLSSLYFLYKLIKDNNQKMWFGFIATSLLNIYNHYYGFVVLLANTIFAVTFLISEVVTSEEKKKVFKRSLFFLCLSLTTIFILYIPYIPSLLDTTILNREIGIGQGATPRLHFNISFFVALFSLFGAGPGIAFYVFGCLFLWGILSSLVSSHRKEGFLVVLWIALPFLFLFIFKPGQAFDAEHVMFILPLYLMMISTGIVSIISTINRFVFRTKVDNSKVLPQSFLLAFILGLLGLPQIVNYYDVAHFRTFAAVSHKGLGDISFCKGNLASAMNEYSAAQKFAQQYYLSNRKYRSDFQLMLTRRIEDSINLTKILSENSLNRARLDSVQNVEGRLEYLKNNLVFLSDYRIEMIRNQNSYFKKFLRFFSRSQKLAMGFYKTALNYEKNHNYREAKKLYEEVIKWNKSLLEAHCSLGNTYLLEGELEKAQKEYETILNIIDRIFAYAPQKVDDLSLNYPW